ncbi:MAG TPA: Ppx/GppA family phosphatase, partial [Sphingopyxis sp.]|nr:Ppx/GppA family phosphatase [Sphingopyxis sp.]
MRQMAAPSGRSPRPGSKMSPPASRRQKGETPPRPVPVIRPRSYAAIDLGTNNCRLLIARPHEGELVVIDAFSRIVRLGEGLHATGRISEAAMDRTVAALAICADKLR